MYEYSIFFLLFFLSVTFLLWPKITLKTPRPKLKKKIKKKVVNAQFGKRKLETELKFF